MADEDQAASGGAGTVGLPLAYPIQTRDGTLSKDSKLVNLLTERTVDGLAAVFKRPGMSLDVALRPIGTTFPSGQPRGLAFDYVTASPVMFVNNRVYYCNGINAAKVLTGTNANSLDAMCYTNRSFFGDSNAPALYKVGNALYNEDFTFIPSLAPANPPPTITTAGVVSLNGRFYLLDRNNGQLRGSDFNTVTSWPALNFTQVDLSLGGPTGIAKHLNYIVAFSKWGTQLYYDAGNPPPGTPLAPVPNAQWSVGCVNGSVDEINDGFRGYSMQSLDDNLYFIGYSNSRGLSVNVLSGLSMSAISTSYIERILLRSNLQIIKSFAYKTAGHAFYGFSLMDLNLTLVFDITSQQWAVWSRYNFDTEQEEAFPSAGFLAMVSDVDSFAHPSNTTRLLILENFDPDFNSKPLDLTPDSFHDIRGTGVTSDVAIMARVVTSPVDWGTLNMKRFPAGNLHADTVDSTVAVRYSDDDYNTFSNWRDIDLSVIRKQLVRLGGARRRSWEFLHTGDTAFRAYLWQLDIAVSSL